MSTTINKQILEIGNIIAKSVTVLGTSGDTFAQGSLVYYSAADAGYKAWAADSGVMPDGVVRNAFTMPAAGSVSAEIIFAGRLNDDKADLPGSMTIDSIPTKDGVAAPAAAVGAVAPTAPSMQRSRVPPRVWFSRRVCLSATG